MENMVKKYHFKNKRILILGNTGFIGSWLSLTLNKLGSDVLGFSLNKKNKNYLSNTKEYKKNIKTINGDIENFTKYLNKIKKFKPEIVVHLASQAIVANSYIKTIETYNTNAMGTVHLLECLKKIKSVKKIIMFTSDKVYKNLYAKTLTEKSNLGGIDPYSSSKSCQDIIANSYYLSVFKKKIQFTILRAGNVIGGGDWGDLRLVPDIFTSIKNKKQIVLRNPSAVRPWQHVLDIVNAILLSINYKKKFDKNANIFNLAPNNKSHINVLTFLKYVKKFLKKKKLKYKYKKIKFYESRVLKLSNKLAKKELKWEPKLNIEDSIKLTTTWYESILKNKKKNYTITIEQINKYFGLRNNP